LLGLLLGQEVGALNRVAQLAMPVVVKVAQFTVPMHNCRCSAVNSTATLRKAS